MGLITEKTPLAAIQPVKFILNWGRRYSLWVMNFGLACCAIEFIAASTSKHDFIRLGCHPVRARPAPGRPAGGRRHADRQDGARAQARVRPDARAEVRDLVRLVLQLRRPVLGLVLGHQGRGPDRADRRLRPRLPAAARGAPARDHPAPGEDRARGHQGEVEWQAHDARSPPERSNRACARSSARTSSPSRTSTGTPSSTVIPGRYRDLVRFLRDEPEFACDYCDFTGGGRLGPRGRFRGDHAPVLHDPPPRRSREGAAAHENPVCPTISDLYPTSNWHERETHEMFGIEFEGHPQPVKLLLPEPFEGHPAAQGLPAR